MPTHLSRRRIAIVTNARPRRTPDPLLSRQCIVIVNDEYEVGHQDDERRHEEQVHNLSEVDVTDRGDEDVATRSPELMWKRNGLDRTRNTGINAGRVQTGAHRADDRGQEARILSVRARTEHPA